MTSPCEKRWRETHREQYNKSNREGNKKYRQNHPEKIKANHNASRDIPLGSECELCPEDDIRTEKLERHHPDYNEPLIIVTVCKECHEGLEE